MTASFKASVQNYSLTLGVSASPYTNEYNGKAYTIEAWVAKNSGYTWKTGDKIKVRIKYNNTDYCEVIIESDNGHYSAKVDSNKSTDIVYTGLTITSASWLSGGSSNVSIN